MKTETQLYTVVNALQRIETGADKHSARTLAAIAAQALEQIREGRDKQLKEGADND